MRLDITVNIIIKITEFLNIILRQVGEGKGDSVRSGRLLIPERRNVACEGEIEGKLWYDFLFLKYI